MTTILVTGATGTVGSRFVPRLLSWRRPGEQVRILVRDRAGARARELVALGARPVVGDVRDEADRARALDGVQAVVNLAASYRGVSDEEVWAVNHDAAIALGRQALAAGARRFVQVGTNLVHRTDLGRPAREDDDLLPDPGAGAYAAAKAAADTGLLELHTRDGLPLVIVRLSFVYGDGDPHLRDAALFAAEWAAHRRMPVVHHADAARALLRALRAPGVAGRIFHAADDAPLSTLDLFRLAGLRLPESAFTREVKHPWEGFVDTLPLRDELGWSPLHPSVWSARDAGAL